MNEKLSRLKQERSAAEMDESGFTLIELLIVIVVLGILAAIVVFALSGVTSSSTIAACNSDAKTVDTAIAAYQTQNSLAPSIPVTQAELTATGTGTLQSWPSNAAGHYAIEIASAASTPAVGATSQDGDVIATNDTIVINETVTPNTYYDATQDPSGACAAV
jgi:prepilin-type N-terminal cleavage/methylation domain-containing protein